MVSHSGAWKVYCLVATARCFGYDEVRGEGVFDVLRVRRFRLLGHMVRMDEAKIMEQTQLV